MTTTRTHRMRVGANFDDTVTAVAAGLAALPHTYMSRVFAYPGEGVPSWKWPTVTALVAGGAKVHKSFKDFDEAKIIADMDAIPAGVSSVVYTFHHEPQDDYSDSAQFVTRSQRLYQLRLQHPNAAKIRAVPILNWWPSAMGGLDWHKWWGPDMGDAMSWDIYPNTLKGYMAADKALKMPLAAAAEVKLPLWVSEIGSTRSTKDPSGTGCAAWMTDMLTGLAPVCERVLWWSALGGKFPDGTRKDMRLRPGSPELDVWQHWTANQ